MTATLTDAGNGWTSHRLRKKVVAFIPARMEAVRFPGKPLVEILGIPMIEHVRRRVCLSDAIDEVYVATCDTEIMDVVARHHGKAMMTAKTHERCTDRIEEAARNVELDIAVIVQGDEPLFSPDLISALVKPLLMDDTIPCTNLLSAIRDESNLHNVDIVKAVVDQQGFVMSFSRSSIPHLRVRHTPPMYRQTGLSAFTKDFLSRYAALPPTPLEIAESIDFLRILEHRYPIVGVMYDKATVGVDRPDDVKKIEKILSEDPVQRDYYRRIKENSLSQRTRSQPSPSSSPGGSLLGESHGASGGVS